MRCIAITKNNTQCTRITTDPSGLCTQHKKELMSGKTFQTVQNVSQEVISAPALFDEGKIINPYSINPQLVQTPPKFTLQQVVNFFNGKAFKSPALNITRAKNEEVIINRTRVCPLDLQAIHNANPQKLQVLLKDNFYQFNILEGILCLTSKLLSDNDLRNVTNEVHQWFLNPTLLGKGANGYAFSTDFGDATKLVVVKSSIDPNNDDLIHELFVGLFSTNILRSIVPNFSFIYGGFKCGAPEMKDNNVVSICSSNSSVHYVMYENIAGKSLEKSLPVLTPAEFIAIYLQLLYAINEAQNTKFTHYDLHAENIILREPFTTQFAIPYNTENGSEYIIANKIATIIDYGYTHIQYEGKNFGKYGLENFGVLESKSFPLFDAYKVLLFCMNSCRKNNLALINTMIPILGFFTNEDYNAVLDVHGQYYFALPDINGLSKVSTLDLARYVRSVTDASNIVAQVPANIHILQCEGTCFTLQSVLS